MQAERTRWNDDRLDEFVGEVHSFRRETSDRFQRLEDKIDARFDKIDARFDKVDARFDKMDARFERLSHTLTYITASLLIAIAASHFAS